ncbi:hypothetical protein AZI85_01325 [Bdellovibrio bacteriovorus]|uniref:SnoaL-like domain-containing protein n=1 Tax=Bdellovibrio bacteriovorus TaxID=959 RepID=A0A150WW20_BDEBC|nr:hypothetical protein AZI85_01325 [Bdellovibrio bacteriovorus]
MVVDLHPHTGEESQIRILYHNLLSAWNKRSAADMAHLFSEDANMIGFDGSHLMGQEEIGKHLATIFFHHPTGSFVNIVRNVRFIAPEVAVLNAVAGMIPPGKTDILPELTAIQTLVSVKDDDHWRISIFQNTPAAFHGRPEEIDKLALELRREMRESFRSEKSAQGF